MHKTFQSHKEKLQELGKLSQCPILDDASYLIMHLFEEGFSIVLYTGTCSSFKNTLIHRNHAVRLILGKDVVVIWHEILLYSGTRTRIKAGGEEGSFKVDIICFCRYCKTYKQVSPNHVLKLK